MNCKFTADGKKVAIVGHLNAKETIVQEIFVNGETEFAAGEHFVVKTLLDTPAETYKAKEERRLAEKIKEMETARDNLQRQIKRYRFDASAAMAQINWVKGIREPEIQEVFDNVKAILCGEYTHVFFPSSMEIKEWTPAAFAKSDNYSRDSFEAMRLVSLYGVWNGRLSMSWKVSTYQDGGGSNQNFIPCRSLEEAIEHARQTILPKEHLSDTDYEFSLKYGIPVDAEKNAKRLGNKAHYYQQQIDRQKETLAKWEAELKALGQEGEAS